MYNKQMDWCIAYGSLMDPLDAKRTLGKNPQVVPAVLDGWQRDWQVASTRSYQCMTCQGKVSRQATALDCQPCISSKIPVVLLEVSPSQLLELDEREDPYHRTRIPATKIIVWDDRAVPAGNFWLYTGRAECRINNPADWNNPFLPAPYQQLVFDAARSWGQDFLDAFQSSIKPAAWQKLDHILIYHGIKTLPACSC